MATIFGALPVILQNGTLADAAQVMADFNKIIADGNANAAENGANSSITSLSGLTSPISAVGGSSSHFNGATSGGTANAQTVATVVPNNWSLTTGNMVSFQPGFSNTGALTLAVAGGSALAVRKMSAAGPVALIANDVVAGQNATVVYDGTAYLLINPSPLAGFGTLTTLASAATTDLGTVSSHNVSITGTTTITSFGSSASTQSPYYFIEFTGALTLTNSASLTIPGGANVTTAANDTAIAEYLGSGNWQISFYQKANGQALVTPSSTAGVLVGIQVFTASGTYTPNASATKAFAILTGGGGAGGGTAAASQGGGGGGAGGTTIAFISSPTTQTVTIGAGGTGVSGATGNSGSTTSLGTITANGGAGGTGNNSTGAGGGGGAATGTGTLGVAGADGQRGNGGNTGWGGAGGGSLWGTGAPMATNTPTAGIAATVFGGGGSGAVVGSTSTTQIGGNGKDGVVVVFEFK